MDLNLDITLANGYTSHSQRARVLTEPWVARNVFCPRCGNDSLSKYSNNLPVADFFCSNCASDFELKSKNGVIGNKIVDGAYEKMVERINCNSNPDFFLMTYDRQISEVIDFIVIPKHFFVNEIIEKRNPLSSSARRAGWIGCNILLQSIPEQGKIYILKDKRQTPKQIVLDKMHKTKFLEDESLETRGWLIDVLFCVNRIQNETFTLADIYEFESELGEKHPENHHIKAKIRQQLQVLRDRGLVEFTLRGIYKKT